MPASATSRWGLNGEERVASLRVRTRPECPEGNQRELTWDSNLNCGIAREREKINQLNTLPAICRTKGLSNSREELAGGGPAHPPLEARGRGEEKGPQRRHPYQTANRLPVSNQRLPEILDGRHPLGGSRLEASSREQTQGTPDWRTETEAGTMEGIRRTAPGESAPVKPLAAWAARQGKAQNAGPTESALWWNIRKLEPHATQGWLHIEQPGAWAV